MIEWDLDLKDPQLLLEETLPRPTPGAWLVLVHDPAVTQRVLGVHRLPDLGTEDVEASYDVSRRRSDHLADLMRSLPVPPRSADSPWTVAATVVVRPGRNVWSWQEWVWARAWRYSHHLTDAIDRDILTVTEHGWSSWLLHEGGPEPRLTITPARSRE